MKKSNLSIRSINVLSGSLTRVEVHTSCDDDFINRVCQEDCLGSLAEFSWKDFFRYTLTKQEGRLNYAIKFYIFKHRRDEILRGILDYFLNSTDSTLVSVTKEVVVPIEAYTKQDIKYVFRYGNKLCKKLCGASTSPLGDIDRVQIKAEQFLEALPSGLYNEDLCEKWGDLKKYFTDFFCSETEAASNRYHRPVTRGRDGMLYSSADMDDAMMRG